MALLDGILKVQLQYCELQLAHVHLAHLWKLEAHLV